jgi:hypothetical protein
MEKRIIIKIISGLLTLWGCILLISGDLTNGFLAIIAGEISDMPKNN